jgi:hypothetical protein
MIKKIITTVLDPETKDKLHKYSQEKYIPTSKIVSNAIEDFNKTLKSLKEYKLKHNDFDRIKTDPFNCSVNIEIYNTITEMAEIKNISNRLILREIITEFVNKKL